MTIRTTLLLLAAAALLPTHAADAPRTELLFSKLAAQQTTAAPANPQQLAQQYPALALLPSGVSEYLTVNIGGILELAGNASPSDMDLPMESLALGGSAASPAFYKALNKLISTIKTQPAPAMGEEAAAPDPEADAELDHALSELSRQNIPPVYLSFLAAPGREEQLRATAMAAVQSPFITPVETLPEGFVAGGKLNGEALLAGRHLSEETRAALRQRPLYLLASVKGAALTFVICENPEAVRLPGSAVNSVLNTAAAQTIRAGKAGQKPLAALHLSPKFMKAMQKANWSSLRDEAEELGKASGQQKNAAVVKEYCRAQLSQEITHPTAVQAWRDREGISLLGSMDAQGMSFKPGRFRLMSLADEDSTIFYAENTPTVRTGKAPGYATLLKAMVELFAADALNQPAEDEGAAVHFPASPAWLPLLSQGAAALETLTKGLEGNGALVVDGKGKAPAFLGGEGERVFPRVSIYAGISQRELLSKGWSQVGAMLADMGMPREALPIETKKAGKATRYSIAHELFDKNFMPNVMLADKHLVLGSTPALNVKLLKAALKGKVPGEGAVFIFRPGALAACMSGSNKDGAPSVSPLTALAVMIDNVHGLTTVKEGVYGIKIRVDFTEKAAE